MSTSGFCKNLSGAILLGMLTISAHGESMLLSGDEKTLWLVRISTDGASYDVLAKPADQSWRWIDKGVSGRVASAATVKNQLHLLFEKRAGYVSYNMQKREPTIGLSPRDPLWNPGDYPVALCGAGEVVGAEASPPSVLAVVPRIAAKTESSIKGDESVQLGVS